MRARSEKDAILVSFMLKTGQRHNPRESLRGPPGDGGGNRGRQLPFGWKGVKKELEE